MAKNNINAVIDAVKDGVDGVHVVTIVEIASGMSLGAYSDGKLDPEVASAYNVEVVKAKLKAISALGLEEGINDILITLETQFHLINCSESGEYMLYVAADNKKSNLAILRGLAQKAITEIS